MIRAWPGGFGNAKVGANYGPSLVAQGEARARGYDQILWLFGEEGYVTEAGGSNFFVLWVNEAGRRELVTAPLGDGTILEGVTRASVLDLVRSRTGKEAVQVVERKFTMDELVRAAEEGRLLEGFGSGTAFFIAPVSDVHFRGLDLAFPLGKEGGEGKGSDFAMGIKNQLKGIMYGRVQHEWGVVVEERAW
jgi:branched-chain amino acid aminotransferase